MRKKTKKRKPTILLYGMVLLVLSFGIYMASSLYLKQYNNQIAFEVQTAERKISVLKTEKEAIKVEIDKLASKSIVVDLAEDEEMEINTDSVVYISGKKE